MMRFIKRLLAALSKKERFTFFAAVVFFGVGSIALFAVSAEKATNAIPASGGSYSEGIVGQPSLINPVLASSEADKALVRLVFMSAKDIASKIESVDDGRTWTLRLKEDLYFHDGKRLTSDDIIFTIQKIQDPDSRSPLTKSWQGILMQRISELELQFNLGIPYAFFEDNLEGLFILPKHLFENIPVANWRISEFNLKPVGSGPYEFAGFDTRSDGFISSYRLSANKEYEARAPYLDSFAFKFYSDAEEFVDAYNTGRIDGFAGGSPEILLRLERPYDLHRFTLPNYYAVFFNQSQSIALKEVEVRKALDLAIDKDVLIKTVLPDGADTAYGPVPEAILPHTAPDSSSLSPREEADTLLTNAGWALGEDGSRTKTIRGEEVLLELRLTVPQIPFLESTAEVLRKSWEAIGVRVFINTLPLSEIVDGNIKNRDYQALLFGHVLTPRADLFSFWHSSQKFYPGLNISLYNNEDADALIESIRQNLDDVSRNSEFQELQTLIMDEAPAVFLYSPHYLYITSRDLKGIESSLLASPGDRVRGAKDWYTKTKLILR